MKKRQNYFEGWYFKHVFGNEILVFIPGIQVRDGKEEAFIKVILNNQSTYIPYAIDQFYAKEDELFIQIGGNIFTRRGIKLCIHQKGIDIDGVIRYGKFNKVRYNIMGPLSFIPIIDSYHAIISMDHALYGSLQIKEKQYTVNEGRGYIESHHGKRLPNNYIWTQCNNFKEPFTSIMTAVADIVCHNILFQGVFAIVLYKGKEYRFATYLGAKVHKCTKNKIILTQKNMLLKISIAEQKIHYYFSLEDRVLIDETTTKGSVTSVMDVDHFLP